MSKHRFLMCPPTFYNVSYEINPHMHKDNWFQSDHNLAQEQWGMLLGIMQAMGAEIDLMTPVMGLPDMVFTANAGYFQKMGNKADYFTASVFKHRERRGEGKYFHGQIKKLGYDTYGENPKVYPGYLEEVYQEGAGDILLDTYRNNMFWLGYGFRTTKKAVTNIENCWYEQDPKNFLELKNPKFYHLDTCFCLLQDGEIMYWPGAFTDEALSNIEHHVKHKHRIILTAQEAELFCANAVVIGYDIIMHQCTDRLKGILADRGYTVYSTNLSTFLKAGGSAACLTLRLPT